MRNASLNKIILLFNCNNIHICIKKLVYANQQYSHVSAHPLALTL